MTLKLLEVMPDVHAGNGIGSVGEHQLCVMAMCAAEVRLRRGEPIGEATDECECVSPVLRALAIERNDSWWESAEARTAWALDLYPRLLGTRDEDRDIRRAKAVARYAVRVIATEAMRSVGLLEEADRLATLADVDIDTTGVDWAAESTVGLTGMTGATGAARAAIWASIRSVRAAIRSEALPAVHGAREAATIMAQAVRETKKETWETEAALLDALLRIAMAVE